MFAEKKLKVPTSDKNGSTMKVPTNPFLKAGFRQSVTTNELGNKATKLLTTGSDFVDQFAKVTNYKAPRSYTEIAKDMELLWNQNPELAVKLTVYLRLITRTVVLPDGTKTSTTQRGQGLKHEGIFRMIWLAINQSDVFWTNVPYFISSGSWKDIFTMLSYDLQYNTFEDRKLDWNKFGGLLLVGLENPNSMNLIKKYLPQIKAKSACKTVEALADNIIGKWICNLLFGETDNTGKTYKRYRHLKTSGTAHEWQQLISRKELMKINFDSIHGRALSQLASSKFLKNQGLEDKYEKWIESKPIAKYTGYIYELLRLVKQGYKNAQLKTYQEQTINKQFLGMIETGKKGMKEGENGLIVVVDTSSSMTSIVPGTKISAYDVAKSMALYFSYLLEGKFANAWMEFNDNAQMKFWTGSTPVAKLQNDRSEAYGSTNFQSLASIFGKYLKQGVPEAEFPTGFLCVSDGCFNSTNSNKSNFKTLLNNLKNYGFSDKFVNNFKVILWDIPNLYYGPKPQTAFEEFADCPNLMHISGLDGSVVAFITGTEAQKSIPKTSEELFLAAMDQEILNYLTIK